MKYGLIGERLGHSFSKEIHERIGKYEYEPKELNEKEFHEFMQKKDFKAINVTIPYKEKVIPYLHYISPEASKIKAVNTIVNKDGLLYGYNTDYLGLKEMISHFNIDVNDKKAMILGTGGTSKTSYSVLKDLNAKEIVFVSRKKTNDCITYDEVSKYASECDILVNTTPLEMYPNNDKHILCLDEFKSLKGVIDVIFNPLKTNLILKAKEGVKNALNSADLGMPLDMLSIDIQEAIQKLGEITGESVSEEVISGIFAKFCLGK